ncbi:MAG: glycosyltransferase [Lachnospiraceae bacterium]|nr:glycosyltransferase [Lachnospiraceae bacterium]
MVDSLNEKAPVVVFAYNRADKIKSCIDSLLMCDGHEETEVFVYSDGAKGENDSDAVRQVRMCLDSFEKEYGFKSLSIIKREDNLGLAGNVISGVSEVNKRYGKVIVLEDDLIVAADFLDFMNEALDFYEGDEDIWSVTGFSEPIGDFTGYGHDVYYSYRGSSYGWGTWSDRWESVDWDIKGYDKVMSDKTLRKNFERGGRDLTRILKDQRMGLVDSWAIRWCLSQSLQNKYTVYPVRSFIFNSGYDGSGTNAPKPENMNSNPHIYGEKVKLEHLAPDERICRDFYRYYSSFIKRGVRNLNVAGMQRILRRISCSKARKKEAEV